MLSKDLESCLSRAFDQARKAHHEFVTVEHLLLAILKADAVRAVLKGCGADLDYLESDLNHYIEEHVLPRGPEDRRPIQPQHAFQRVLQRAVLQVKTRGGSEVGVLDVLITIFSEKHTHAALELSRMQVPQIAVVNYIAGLAPH